MTRSPRAFAIASVIAVVLGTAPASADPLGSSGREGEGPPPGFERPDAPWVFEWLQASLSTPRTTVAFRTGAHGWLADRVRWEVHLEGLQMLGPTDLSGDGVEDYRPSRAGPHVGAGAAIGVPLLRDEVLGDYYTRHTGAVSADGRRKPLLVGAHVAVRDLSLIVGVRAALDASAPIAVPLGLRFARREYTAAAYMLRERWIDVRALAFVHPWAIGAEAEVAWLPLPWGGALFAQYVPRLADGTPPVCGPTALGQACAVDYPMTIFNPVPYGASLQLGLRLRLHHPF